MTASYSKVPFFTKKIRFTFVSLTEWGTEGATFEIESNGNPVVVQTDFLNAPFGAQDWQGDKKYHMLLDMDDSQLEAGIRAFEHRLKKRAELKKLTFISSIKPSKDKKYADKWRIPIKKPLISENGEPVFYNDLGEALPKGIYRFQITLRGMWVHGQRCGPLYYVEEIDRKVVKPKIFEKKNQNIFI